MKYARHGPGGRWLRLSQTLLLLAVGASCTGDRVFSGAAVVPPVEIESFSFSLASGATYRTAPEAGRPMVLFFGYTNCPDVCPTTLADWKRAKQRLGKKAGNVRFVFVTVDPARDTPAIADEYAKRFDSAFVGLSADSATTARMLQAFGAAAQPEATAHDAAAHAAMGRDDNAAGAAASPPVHSGATFLLDSNGRWVATHPLGGGWDVLAADIQRLRL